MRLVEVIPNFSEGRRDDVVSALADVFRRAQGVTLLDAESDASHNRSVLTAIGEPEAVSEAAFAAVRLAMERIDLNHHQGEHPRMGATDVVPFVPVTGVTMAEAVDLATTLAERIWRELAIPTFLYEEAAKNPGRRSLPAIRKGGFEGLRDGAIREPGREPDFGPTEVHPTAGVTAVGARKPLVAFNVNLKSTDMDLARTIAKAVRESSGGLKNVRAIAVDLTAEGLVQVSMNLVDTETSPIFRAFEFVQREAEARGVVVASSEIVGLVGLSAIADVARRTLRLKDFSARQVLEARLIEGLFEEDGDEGA